jgi:outer membrane protein, heavy metal efflux system
MSVGLIFYGRRRAPGACRCTGITADIVLASARAGLLSIIVLGFALQSMGSANGETRNSEYTLPSSVQSTEAVEFNEPRGALSLPHALSLALLRNPALAAAAREIRAQGGAVEQAGLLPNPVFSASGQNAGNSVLQGFDGEALTFSLSQTILLGGKRAKAIRLAELDRDLAVWDYESKRMDVLTEVVLSYIDLLKAQEGLVLAHSLVEIADQTLAAVSTRVRFGKASPVEETRARVRLGSVQIDRQRAERALATARKRLAATWASTSPEFETVQGKLEPVQPIPSFDALMERLAQNPDLARWASETVQRQATIELAESRAIPNLTVSLGVQQYLRTGDSAFAAGISIPLPLFNRNQGRIRQASQRFSRALEMKRNVEVLLATTLNTAYQQLSTDYAEVTTLEETVLPGAQSAFEAIEYGYRRGKFSQLDVLQAQRTLFSARIQHLAALARYHQSNARIERLIGESLEAPKHLRSQNEQ